MPNGPDKVYELIDRHHTEHKARSAQLEELIRSIEKTQHEHGYRLDDIASRLSLGAQRFAEIESVTKPALWKVVSAVVLLLGLVGGWGFMLARYPSWDEVKDIVSEQSPYNADKAEVMRVVESYQAQMPAIQLRLGIMDAKLDRIVKTLERDE